MDYQDYQLLELLADGKYHSGEYFARQFNSSRAAICKRISKINSFLKLNSTLIINTVTGRGYCLNQEFDYINQTKIISELKKSESYNKINLELFPSIDSTNNYLINKTFEKQQNNNIYNIAITDHQTSGRGRVSASNNKYWFSPFGRNIYLSIGCYYAGVQHSLLGFSIIIGIVIAEILEELVSDKNINIGLKWPNDVYIDNKKIAGILTEIQGEPNGFCKLVVGMGINIYNNKNNSKFIDQPYTTLDEILNKSHNNQAINRSIIIAKIINKFIYYYQDFVHNGLEKYIIKWKNFDILAGKMINLNLYNDYKSGKVVGINNQGALIVNINGENQLFHSGEVSVRVS